MKDPIEKLLKESKVEISHNFTDQLMNELNQKLERRMRFRLYLLMFAILIFSGLTTYLLVQAGFQIDAFGFSIEVPKIGPVVIMCAFTYLTVMHLNNLLRVTNS